MAQKSELENDLKITLYNLRFLHEEEVKEVQRCVRHIRQSLNDFESNPDEVFTPGNLASLCARLEVARSTARALLNSLKTVESAMTHSTAPESPAPVKGA